MNDQQKPSAFRSGFVGCFGVAAAILFTIVAILLVLFVLGAVAAA